MKKWKKARIGDICSVNSYTYSPKENWKFVNYLDTGNITDNNIDTIQYIEINKDKLPSRARRKVQKNSIVYSTVRPVQKHHGIIKSQVDHLLVSTGFAVLDAKKELVDADFLYYFLTQPYITNSLQAIAEQSTSAYPAIKPSDIEDVEILLPEINLQKEIAKFLNLFTHKIDILDRINKNLEEQVITLYKAYFIDSILNDRTMPPTWRHGTVSEIVEIHDAKRVPLSNRERATLAKIYPYYGATSIMDYVDKYLFEGIYLLLAEDGTVVDNKGYPVLQYVDGKFWVNNHAHILTGKNGYTTELLYLLFKLTNVNSIVTGAVQPKINQSNLLNLGIIIPSRESLENFNTLIQPFFAEIRKLRAANHKLVALKNSLLPKLISGNLNSFSIND